jgi:hypothetical protein
MSDEEKQFTLENDPLQELIDEFRKEHEQVVKEAESRAPTVAPQEGEESA